ncbi:hypothetical protein D3C80_2058680 [compost metagenome]
MLRRVTAVSGGDLRGGLGKGLVFKNGVGGVLQALCLLGLSANFEGLVMVRLKVIKV